MADTITAQRGNIATHQMHIYAEETPTALWASLEAQNEGIIAGNWQSHLAASDDTHRIYTGPVSQLPSTPTIINRWRTNWPPLGSYSRLSFWSVPEETTGAAVRYLEYVLWLYDAGYSATFYDATVAATFTTETGGWEAQRIYLPFSMEDAGLESYIGDNIFIEVRAYLSWSGPYYFWNNEFLLVTSNLPL